MMNHKGYLTEEQEETLEALLRKPTMPHGIGQRANALLLLNKGMSYNKVADVLYLNGETVRGWYQSYQSETPMD